MLLGDRQVGELHWDIRPPAYLDSLLDGGQVPARSDPRVSGVAYGLAERHDLVCRRVTGGRPDRPVDALLHRLHPVGVYRTVVQRARGDTQRRVADLRGGLAQSSRVLQVHALFEMSLSRLGWR